MDGEPPAMVDCHGREQSHTEIPFVRPSRPQWHRSWPSEARAKAGNAAARLFLHSIFVCAGQRWQPRAQVEGGGARILGGCGRIFPSPAGFAVAGSSGTHLGFRVLLRRAGTSPGPGGRRRPSLCCRSSPARLLSPRGIRLWWRHGSTRRTLQATAVCSAWGNGGSPTPSQ